MKGNCFIDIDGIYDYHCINFLFISINEKNWFAESMFFRWGSFDGICISCEVPSIADTPLGILEQYLFFATRLGWLATEFYDYTFSISLPMLNIKLCQQLKH